MTGSLQLVTDHAVRFLVYINLCMSFVCSEVYCGGDLLREVQTSLVFNDSKEFVDMPMKADPG